MFDILAATYMNASRMDHFLEQDFLHKDPMISRRLRYIHGLDDPNPTLSRQLRMRVGMDGAIERAHKPLRIFCGIRLAVSYLGRGVKRLGQWMEGASAQSFQREVCPNC